MKNNKNCHLFAFICLLTACEVFEEVQLGFLIVGHTHEHIHGSFGYLSKIWKIEQLCHDRFDESMNAFKRSSIHSTIHSRNP